jgi:solute carrier family 44 (choline transporter-like protein), member 2/4/5
MSPVLHGMCEYDCEVYQSQRLHLHRLIKFNTAIKGTAFFASAGAATALLIRNAAKTIAVDFVAEFILFTSKIIVAAINGFGIYMYLTYVPNNFGTIRNPYVIVAVGTVAAFIVAMAFFSIYHMAIDTIYLSALEDMEHNDGSLERPYYMPGTIT